MKRNMNWNVVSLVINWGGEHDVCRTKFDPFFKINSVMLNDFSTDQF